ncbi:MAG: amidohydrolase [Peptococcaceae bacterium]|jgi:imidazolonepropionase-like amidohydrolase|nr:amidohydrolase [Peptococcaceae bacterium]MDH7526113.1 amidohydrolase [Peptococcaceae bacterium]
MEQKALMNARIYTMNGKVLEKGSILWAGGKIIAVGEGLKIPAGAAVTDLGGKTVVPGFIDAHTHLGILEEIYQEEGDDLNEATEPVTPEMRALDAVNPNDRGFRDAVQGGVTTVMTGPGSSNVVGGTVLVMKTAGRNLQEMVLIPQAGLKVAFGENPKRTYAEQKKMPVTRMGIAALLRQAFVDAQVYAAKKEKSTKDGEVLERDLGMETMLRVLNREMPLRAHAHRADDIMTALRIAGEFGLEIVLEHGTEAHKLVPELLEQGVPVVLGPSFSNRSKVELAEMSWRTAAKLNEAGVLVALTTDHSVTPVQYLPVCAAMAVRNGMDEMEALKAITINPARILKLDHRLGSLAAGKDADMVVISGHPLDWRSRVEMVYIDGKLVYERL